MKRDTYTYKGCQYKRRRPEANEVQALKDRHGLTYAQMADAVYELTDRRAYDYCTGRRSCPESVWFSLVLEFDGIDLRTIGNGEA